MSNREIVLCFSVLLKETSTNFADTNSTVQRSHFLIFIVKESNRQKKNIKRQKTVRTVKYLQS